MAPVRPSHRNEPPASSSEETSSEEEEEQQKPRKTFSSPDGPAGKKPTKRKQPSEPATSKIRSAKRRLLRESASVAAANSPGQAKKKASEAEKDEEEPKKSSDGGDERKLFQRLWSDDDEVVILEGLVNYSEKNGSHPADMGELVGLVGESLSIHVSATQLKNKVRRLRRKYRNNAVKNKFNPAKPHEKRVFELSRKIWGEHEEGVKVEAKCGSGGPLWSSWTGLLGFRERLAEYVMRQGLGGLVSEEKAAEMEARRKEIGVAELELFEKRTRLISEQAKLVYEALKSLDR